MAAEFDDERFMRLWALLDRLAIGVRRGVRWSLVHEGPLPHHASARAAQLANGYWATLCLWARKRRVPRVEVTPLDLQRFALGRRATPGAGEMLERARSDLGYDGDDHNEADAKWLLRFAERGGKA